MSQKLSVPTCNVQHTPILFHAVCNSNSEQRLSYTPFVALTLTLTHHSTPSPSIFHPPYINPPKPPTQTKPSASSISPSQPTPATPTRPHARHQRLPGPLLRLHLPLLLHNLLLLHHAHGERHAQHHRPRHQHPEPLATDPGALFRNRDRRAQRAGEEAPRFRRHDVPEGEEAAAGGSKVD